MIIDSTSILDFDVLTKHRVPGAIPIFGKFRMIDIALSNAAYSKITNVAIFAYGNYRSLTDHIGSGKRYNLDRRKDGIFILPPKNFNPIVESYISFQRMREQIEYLNRSDQEYVIITPSTILWLPDLEKILNAHIESDVDITEVLGTNKERLYTFILSKEKLMNYVMSYDEISYRNIVEVYDFSPSETKGTYIYERFARFIKNYREYYRTTMNFVQNFNITDVLYEQIDRLRTKDPVNGPTYYSENACVSNSFISSGAYIDGTIENSVLSRRVKVCKNAFVKNSVIMNNAIIEEGAIVENAVLDKETVVKKGIHIKGSPNDPFLSEKRQTIVSSVMPKVVVLSAEASPFIKRGGLADMVGSLVKELSLIGAEVKVFLPLYKEIKEKYMPVLHFDREKEIEIDGNKYRINIYSYLEEKTAYYFVDLYMYFDRDKIYGYEDDPYRFAYYTKAVCEYLKDTNYRPDIIHFHDWHSSLLPLFVKKDDFFSNTKTILTIHNLNYQGITNKEIFKHFELDYYESSTMANLLEVGINSCDRITTVSKTYAEELKYSFFSGGLQDAIQRRYLNLYGIVNGLDSKINPSEDLEIKSQYDANNVFENKEINKKYLCDLCGFKYSKDTFVIGMVSRIDEIKGFELIINSIDEIMLDPNTNFVLLGVGDEYLMGELKKIEIKYPGRVKLFLDYYGTKPSYIYSGADVFLMPSRIEPCGTSQMIALKYGTIPIVRQTGGLNDTIQSFDNTTLTGNGFKFYNYDSRDLINSVKIAREVYSTNNVGWMALILNAMSSNNSFEKCAKEYLNLYISCKKD